MNFTFSFQFLGISSHTTTKRIYLIKDLCCGGRKEREIERRESEKRERRESEHKRGLNALKAVYSVPQSGRLLTVLLIDTTHTTGARRENSSRLD